MNAWGATDEGYTGSTAIFSEFPESFGIMVEDGMDVSFAGGFSDRAGEFGEQGGESFPELRCCPTLPGPGRQPLGVAHGAQVPAHPRRIQGEVACGSAEEERREKRPRILHLPSALTAAKYNDCVTRTPFPLSQHFNVPYNNIRRHNK